MKKKYVKTHPKKVKRFIESEYKPWAKYNVIVAKNNIKLDF